MSPVLERQAELQNFYIIIKIEDPRLKGMSCAKVALINEVDSTDRLLAEFSAEKICRFMRQFTSVSILTGQAKLQFEDLRFKVPSDNYTAMIITTDEIGFRAWQTFVASKIKTYLRNAAIGFRRFNHG